MQNIANFSLLRAICNFFVKFRVKFGQKTEKMLAHVFQEGGIIGTFG